MDFLLKHNDHSILLVWDYAYDFDIAHKIIDASSSQGYKAVGELPTQKDFSVLEAQGTDKVDSWFKSLIEKTDILFLLIGRETSFLSHIPSLILNAHEYGMPLLGMFVQNFLLKPEENEEVELIHAENPFLGHWIDSGLKEGRDFLLYNPKTITFDEIVKQNVFDYMQKALEIKKYSKKISKLDI